MSLTDIIIAVSLYGKELIPNRYSNKWQRSWRLLTAYVDPRSPIGSPPQANFSKCLLLFNVVCGCVHVRDSGIVFTALFRVFVCNDRGIRVESVERQLTDMHVCMCA